MVVENKCFSSKLVTKEASVANASCRVYYGEAGAVPFRWESQPGTPIHKLSESSLPPLTLPPSYSTSTPNSKSTHKFNSKSKLLASIFPKLVTLRKVIKAPNMSLSPSSSSSSTTSYSSSSCSSSFSKSPISSKSPSSLWNQKGQKHRCFSASRMPFEKYGEDYDEHHPISGSSPTSTLWSSGVKRKSIRANFNRIRGCFTMPNVKVGF